MDVAMPLAIQSPPNFPHNTRNQGVCVECAQITLKPLSIDIFNGAMNRSTRYQHSNGP